MSPALIKEFSAHMVGRGRAAPEGTGRHTWISSVPVEDGPSSSGGGSRRASAWHGPDAYAFGVILWEMLTLKRPFEGRSQHEIWLLVRQGSRPHVTPAEASAAPAGYLALMRELWAQDPVERPTFAEALRRLSVMAEQYARTVRQHGRGRRREQRQQQPTPEPLQQQPPQVRQQERRRRRRRDRRRTTKNDEVCIVGPP